jgi:hypothetical protein
MSEDMEAQTENKPVVGTSNLAPYRQVPSLGRIVHYCWCEKTETPYPDIHHPGHYHLEHSEAHHRASAIITHVYEDESCDLHIFWGPYRDPYLGDDRHMVKLLEPNHLAVWWDWPPHVPARIG